MILLHVLKSSWHCCVHTNFDCSLVGWRRVCSSLVNVLYMLYFKSRSREDVVGHCTTLDLWSGFRAMPPDDTEWHHFNCYFFWCSLIPACLPESFKYLWNILVHDLSLKPFRKSCYVFLTQNLCDIETYWVNMDSVKPLRNILTSPM